MLEGQLSDLNGALDRIAFFPDGTRERLQECTKTRLEPVYAFLGMLMAFHSQYLFLEFLPYFHSLTHSY